MFKWVKSRSAAFSYRESDNSTSFLADKAQNYEKETNDRKYSVED
jgi:hypothetical protein